MNGPPPAVNADSREFWEAAREHRLIIKRCDACTRVFFPPRYLCPFCWSDKTSCVQSSGRGTVYSYTVMYRAPAPEFAALAPYVVALIDLEEGPRMMANIVGPRALETAVDDRVAVCFEDRGDGWKVPQFQRIAS